MATTFIIIGLTALVSFSAFNKPDLRNKLIFHPWTIGEGKDYYRFISSGFIHADMQHLFFNMFTLFFFGMAAEQNLMEFGGDFPRIKFWILYLGSMLMSHIFVYFKYKEIPSYASLGASGAVSGVLFSFILFDPWGTLYIFFAIPVPAIILGIGYLYYSMKMAKEANDNIGHEAHFYGAVAGIILTFAFNPSVVFDEFITNIQDPRWSF